MSGLRGYLLFLACYIAYAMVLLPAVVAATSGGAYEAHGESAFAQRPKDRPVLETPQQVWEARTTGVCTFKFDGTLYVVENMPRHYVDYSSWYVRMP